MDGDGKAAFWTFAGMGIAFKLVTSVIIFVMAPSAHSAIFLFVMQWYWLLLPLPLIVPLMFWYRLRRVRRRRQQLIYSEWTVEPDVDWNPTSVRGTM